MRKSDLEDYEDAVISGRSVKRVREVGDLGLVGAQIPQFSSGGGVVPFRAVQGRSLASSVAQKLVAAAPSRIVVPPSYASNSPPKTVMRTGNVRLPPLEAEAPRSSILTHAASSSSSSAYAGGGSDASDDTSIDSGGPMAFAPDDSADPAPRPIDTIGASAGRAVELAVARLAAAGAVVGPISARRVSVDSGDVQGLGALEFTTAPTAMVGEPSYTPIVVALVVGIAAIAGGAYRKGRR